VKPPFPPETRRPRSFRNMLRALFAVLMVGGLLATTAVPAQAATVLCSSAGYACTTGNYAGQSTWGYPLDSNGHNCTNYAAYKLAQNGAANPGNLGDANNWDTNAAAKGFPVDNNPVVGSIAQWNNQHVAYVEVVHPDYVETTDDSWGGGTRRMKYYRNQSGWPDNFIHIKDVPPVVDSDNDGFNNDVDLCPNTWGKWRGCPQRSDFNNDGRAEVASFYRHDGNLTDLNLWNGLPGASTSLPYRPWSGTGWDGSRIKSAGSGNFNGDRYQDTASFFVHTSGAIDLNIWYGDANGGLNQGRGWQAPSGWELDRLKPAGAADFNSDGRADIAAFYRHNGFATLLIWFGQTNGEMHLYTAWTGNDWDGNRIVTVGAGDVDGDGRNDISTFYDHDGDMVDYNVWYNTGSGNATNMFTLGRPWHRATGWDVSRFVPGGLHDLNNDGRAEAIVFYNHPGGSLVDMRTWPGTSNRVISGEPGGPWSGAGWDGSRIIPAGTDDYNGDGAGDIATFYRHNSGVDMNIWYGNGTGALTLERPWTAGSDWEGARLIPAKG
jgi:surface antigen